jgi:uncharacterized protein involved in exopolysaccharide biosynthesis
MLVDPASPPRVSPLPPADEPLPVPRPPSRPSAVVRYWPVVAGITLAIALLAWVIAGAQPKRYRASAIGAVSPLTEQLSASDIIRGVDSLERRVVVASIAALAAVPGTKRLAQAPSDYTITAAVMPNTNLFRIEVEGPDARRAADIANRVPAVLASDAQKMYKLFGVTLVSEATPPAEPALPRKERALAAGIVAGLLAGSAVAWLLDRRRRA